MLCLCVGMFAVGGRNSKAGVPGGAAAASGSGASSSAPAAQVFKLGSDAKVGAVRWNFSEATNVGNTLPKGDASAGDFAQEAKTSGTFVKVRVEIENTGADQLSFTSVDLKDSQGRTFKSSSDFNVLTHIPNEEQCFLKQLNPNIVKTCTAYFEVPAGVTNLQAVIGDLAPFGEEDGYVDLGF